MHKDFFKWQDAKIVMAEVPKLGCDCIFGRLHFTMKYTKKKNHKITFIV